MVMTGNVVTASIPAAPAHPFATNIPNRSPRFKTHKGIGQAKNAVIQKLHGGKARHDMTIFRLENGHYLPLITIHAGQTRDDIPELATPPKPRSHIRWEISSLIEREQYHRQQAEQCAEQRRALEESVGAK